MRRTYLIVLQEEEDGGPVIKRLNGDEIRKFVKKNKGDQRFFTLIEGNVIKGEMNTIDLSKL